MKAVQWAGIIAVILLLLLLIPFSVAIVRMGSRLGRSYAVGPPARVEISPGQITIGTDKSPVQLSAQAYDSKGKMVTKDVIYEWGLSSLTNTLGDLVPNNQLATFTPTASSGQGTIWVKASTAGGQAISSVEVIVGISSSPGTF